VVAAAAADHNGIAAHFAASPTEPGSGPAKTNPARITAKTAIPAAKTADTTATARANGRLPVGSAFAGLGPLNANQPA
jgi:hypothetical protein